MRLDHNEIEMLRAHAWFMASDATGETSPPNPRKVERWAAIARKLDAELQQPATPDQEEGEQAKREAIESFAAELIGCYEQIAREVPDHQVQDCLNVADEVRHRRDIRLKNLAPVPASSALSVDVDEEGK